MRVGPIIPIVCPGDGHGATRRKQNSSAGNSNRTDTTIRAATRVGISMPSDSHKCVRAVARAARPRLTAGLRVGAPVCVQGP